MNATPDEVGDLLRSFYGTFGMPNEGPGPDVNVTDTLGEHVSVPEFTVLQDALNDSSGLRHFRDCKTLLDELATRLVGDELLRELSAIPVPDGRNTAELSNGVFWFALAASLNRRDGGIPVTPFDSKFDLPLPVKVQMTVQGSLILRLYLALVYMREGVLADLIAAGARSGRPCCGRVKKLLNSDYVRMVRNALSHGSFTSCAAGLVFRDERHVVVATPGFLNWLCTWMMAATSAQRG